MPTRLGPFSIDQIYLGNIKISKAYLGQHLVFDGNQWTWCLLTSDNCWLQTSDGLKIRPKLEEVK